MNGQQKRPSVRFNLNKPRHRQAWEYLQSQSKKNQSHTEIIVDALVNAASGELPEVVGSTLCRVIRETVKDALNGAIGDALRYGSLIPSAVPSEPDESAPMTEEDFDAAMDFMDGL